ncbi:PhzF family phenazine biosynthesis protein [Swingsia samuiensis]|uniref:PhzF family phenazine biosynthesis protein n=1 Tax=Swingsia samuiensis TaxID=1293412 RepID=A0A4Y6UL66_9PROT|nr:PhzF family phenazine biosynthesis protein [Swingsia samuiensis]QDH17206.1 PhzF family phenazine biosynthesis protein [Swingsia samuiensis]
MRRSYITLDVFTDQMFGGNPLAVVLNAEGLSSDQMQKIAIEFGYSETTFVLPPQHSEHTAQVRIFTPGGEIPFAGHPNIGTAFALVMQAEKQGKKLPDTLLFEEQAGTVLVKLWRQGGAVIQAELRAPEQLSRRSRALPEAAAACLGLQPEDIQTDHHAPQIISVGLPFLIVELTSRDALRRARGDLVTHLNHLKPLGVTSIYAYTRDRLAEEESDIQARMFSPIDGIVEDPATGSATAATIAFLSVLENVEENALTFSQGVDMGRPSLLKARFKEGWAYVLGTAVPVMEGCLVAAAD